MKNSDRIRDELIQHDVSREFAKLLALSLDEIDKYE